jgi:pilus assembly protein CpaC
MSPSLSAIARHSFVVLGLLLMALPAWAQQSQGAEGTHPAVQQQPARPTGLALDISQGKLIVLPEPASSVFIADPAIADVQLANSDHVFVFGKKAGRTTLYAVDADGVLIKSTTVEVNNPIAPAQRQIEALPGGDGIHVKSTTNGILLEGQTTDAETAAAAERIAIANAPDKAAIANEVKIRSPMQVTLRVRIAEVSRAITKELGINWNVIANSVAKIGTFSYGLSFAPSLATPPIATVSGGFASSQSFNFLGLPTTVDANAVLDALAEEQLITILAEPNLTAISGEKASFLAGGEFPVPVAQGLGTLSIQFQSYGVALAFVPTVMSPNHISLHVAPEVSELTSVGSITIPAGTGSAAITIPGLTVRRAETTIELGSGQSFAIAGLLQNDATNDVQRFPGLGDLPVLGPLFRSSSFQRNESELLIVVTPYIVKPIDDPRAVRLPTDAWQPATDVERILYGFEAEPFPQGTAPSSSGSSSAPRPHLLGAAGFEVE